ncbi:NADP-dependent oxidoreductase domain-containing protein [Mucidula mucida]|nr:NADP-dependent oxidoreductase domain-containing protein [Mucidula mucida]
MSPATFKLNTGADIPAIGIGASPAKVPEGKDTARWLVTALKAGYRHIDTANIYGTEAAVAEAIESSGVPREEIFITTKLNWTKHHCIQDAIEESLNNLKTTYIDLVSHASLHQGAVDDGAMKYLLHWPQCADSEDGSDFPKNPDGTYKLTTRYHFADSWKQLELAYHRGTCRAIGVSNFSIKTLEELSLTAEVTPAINQVEMHPYLAQNELLSYCKGKGIMIAAYTPGGRNVVRSDPEIAQIATRYDATPTQVILAWHAARGTVALPKSINETRQRENLLVPDLQDKDVERITALDRNERVSNAADSHGQVYGWSFEQLGW